MMAQAQESYSGHERFAAVEKMPLGPLRLKVHVLETSFTCDDDRRSNLARTLARSLRGCR